MEPLEIVLLMSEIMLLSALVYLIYIHFKVKKELKNITSRMVKYQKAYREKDAALDNSFDKINLLQKENIQLREFLRMFILGKTTVYTNSNFHNSYNFHNSRYYAKINKKPTDNKAEAIPLLNISENKYVAIDLYKLKAIIGNKRDIDLVHTIRECMVVKQTLITHLGNKILKGYKG